MIKQFLNNKRDPHSNQMIDNYYLKLFILYVFITEEVITAVTK